MKKAEFRHCKKAYSAQKPNKLINHLINVHYLHDFNIKIAKSLLY